MSTYKQLVTPDLTITVKPGYCERAVENAFGTGGIYGSATLAWKANTHHTDDRPDNCYVPVYFSMDDVEDGHVAISAPDGKIYSTTSSTSTKFTVHNSLDDMIEVYQKYHPTIKYLGWGGYVGKIHVVEPAVDPISIVKMSNPRVLMACTNIHKFDADSLAYQSSVSLSKGDYRLFNYKFEYNGITYVRTKYDTDNNNRLGFNLNNLLEIPSSNEIVNKLI